MRECCGAYIRYELKITPFENAARVFLTWTILQMEMNNDFKKNEQLLARPPYAADPKLIMHPLRLRGYMISMGSAA